MNLTKKHKTLIIRLSIGIFLLIALILYINVKAIKEIVNILVISIILAYILLPIKRYGIKKFNIKDGYMALIIILFIVGVFLSVIFFLIPSMFNEISSLGPSIDKLYEYIEDLKNKFNFLNAPLFNFLYETIKEKATAAFVTITEGILEGVIKFSEDLVSIAIVPVVTYYFLADTTSIVKRVYMFIPIEKRNFVKTIIEDIDKLLGRYIVSQLILSLIISVLTFFILLVLKVKFSLWLSLLNGVFNIVPYFGPIFGMIPIFVVAFLDTPSKALWALIALIILQQIEGNILSPKITGDSTNMHPLIIIVLLLIGEKFGGFIGMILAVPIGVIIKVIYEDLNYYLL